MRYSSEAINGIAETFIEVFTNRDSMELLRDCPDALRVLYARADAADLIPFLPAVRSVFSREPFLPEVPDAIAG